MLWQGTERIHSIKESPHLNPMYGEHEFKDWYNIVPLVEFVLVPDKVFFERSVTPQPVQDLSNRTHTWHTPATYWQVQPEQQKHTLTPTDLISKLSWVWTYFTTPKRWSIRLGRGSKLFCTSDKASITYLRLSCPRFVHPTVFEERLHIVSPQAYLVLLFFLHISVAHQLWLALPERPSESTSQTSRALWHVFRCALRYFSQFINCFLLSCTWSLYTQHPPLNHLDNNVV